MSDITPALTAEEWTTAAVDLADEGHEKDPETGTWYSGDPPLRATVDAEGLHLECSDSFYSVDVPTRETVALMALANAALSDDDPRKITREDIRFEPLTGRGWHMADEADKLTRLIAKLAALLPPE